MAVTASDFTESIQMNLPSMDTPLAEKLVRETIREACLKYNLWVESTELTFGNNNYAYIVPPVAGAKASVLLGLTLPSHLTFSTPLALDTTYQRLVARRTVKQGTKVTATIAFVPTEQTSRYPDEFASLLYDAIIAGCLGRAYGMRGKPWSNMDQAKEERRRFLQMCGSARYAKMTGNTSGTRTVM